jgi:hypothetical protein
MVPDAAMAASKSKKHNYRAARHVRVYSERERTRPDDGYYERLADKLPVGSQRWFDQMQREGRFGRDP